MDNKLIPGGEYLLKAVRVSELGVFLDAGTGNLADDILLHNAQQTRPVKVGEEVQVSLYLDPKKRLTASMRLAEIKEGAIGQATVLSVTKQGGFVDIGAERGVFLPFSQMRGKVHPGQKPWVKLYRDKSGRQAVTMLIEKEIIARAVAADGVKRGEKISGWVYNSLDDGWLLFTQENYTAFLHKDELARAEPLIGEQVTGRVIFVRPDGKLNISQKEQKETALEHDAQKILAFLAARHGRMPYSDDTPPVIIKEKFLISKAAFKRAMGHLMKEGKISQENGWTILTDEAIQPESAEN
jgi:predicted RNA-binding protein (virulence factor B family)